MKKYLFLFFTLQALCTLSISDYHKKQYIVILDPAGDAKRTERHIGDNFERGLTLQCAEKIKEIIEQRTSHINVIITRMPGDVVYDLQNATLANRLHADLFINLNFYYCKETKPTVFLYQFSYGDDFACQQGLQLNTYDQAYKINKSMTDDRAQRFKQSLSDQKYHAMHTVAGVYKVPIKPLIGIVTPSIALDAGLKSKESWMQYAELLANTIIQVFE